jgi:hypothetical protein
MNLLPQFMCQKNTARALHLLMILGLSKKASNHSAGGWASDCIVGGSRNGSPVICRRPNPVAWRTFTKSRQAAAI